MTKTTTANDKQARIEAQPLREGDGWVAKVTDAETNRALARFVRLGDATEVKAEAKAWAERQGYLVSMA